MRALVESQVEKRTFAWEERLKSTRFDAATDISVLVLASHLEGLLGLWVFLFDGERG